MPVCQTLEHHVVDFVDVFLERLGHELDKARVIDKGARADLVGIRCPADNELAVIRHRLVSGNVATRHVGKGVLGPRPLWQGVRMELRVR